ncbi:hypothetical protein ACFL25_00535 [Patescibacteria group bacterium]
MAKIKDPQKGFASLGDILKDYKESDKDKFISREFQKYGYDLAKELGDLRHKSLYIKLAKETPRGYLEAAKSYVKDAENVKNKGALFMWRLKKLKEEKKKKATKKSKS